jgi:hypothetical protein
MSETIDLSGIIDLGGIKIPAADLAANPESIKLVLKFSIFDREQTMTKLESLICSSIN